VKQTLSNPDQPIDRRKIMTKDPVCGMNVNDKKAPTSTYEGKRYAFCGPDCKEAFDRNPAKYATADERQKVGKT